MKSELILSSSGHELLQLCFREFVICECECFFINSFTAIKHCVELEASFSPTVLRSHDQVTLVSDPMSRSRSIAT